MSRVFVLTWGGGDEPEIPAVSVHASRAGAIGEACRIVRDTFEPQDYDLVKMRADLIDVDSSDASGTDGPNDTYFYISPCEVQS